jgi:hypothetical protein
MRRSGTRPAVNPVEPAGDFAMPIGEGMTVSTGRLMRNWNFVGRQPSRSSEGRNNERDAASTPKSKGLGGVVRAALLCPIGFLFGRR